MCAEILDALKQVRLNDDIRVLILTGTGRGFCSGGDISPDAGFDEALAHQLGRARELREDAHAVVMALHRLDKPVICAINGLRSMADWRSPLLVTSGSSPLALGSATRAFGRVCCPTKGERGYTLESWAMTKPSAWSPCRRSTTLKRRILSGLPPRWSQTVKLSIGPVK
ncbi:enoyl-CoA hydratase/isomerase family protein [Mycobacterium xenopi 4042]|uniref:Enoyl-CoA hydratase/isomerase family protein n=1 Tax=Mycobacterium xenopi 4042 TaxID=1299334 RepID=X7ZWK5_MYCXE|nr:enoyl-CoA hydratase/isomerase family protein [Mycobacterium xenopi 4042]